MKTEIFLSHSSHDVLQARRLRKSLLAHGVNVWFSPHHIRGAQQWQDEIGKALARCNWFALLLTPDSVKSTWVKRELNYALIERRYKDRIIPLLLQKCDLRALSWTLPQFQIIDFRKGFAVGCNALVQVVKQPRNRGRRPSG